MKPLEIRQCVYGSKTGWVALAAKYKDVRDASDAKVSSACGAAFDAAVAVVKGRK
jgi:hypothetical protein